MSDTSTNLLLPFLAAAQAQKHVTVNEALLKLDALVQLAVVSATTSAEPGSPSDGQVYILPAGKTNALGRDDEQRAGLLPRRRMGGDRPARGLPCLGEGHRQIPSVHGQRLGRFSQGQDRLRAG